MEEMEENIQNIERKINKLNDFISLSLRRNKISKDLEHVTADAIKVRDLITKVNELMKSELYNYEDDYEVLMSQMRKKQIIIMQYTIEEKKRKLKAEEEEEKKLQAALSCSKPKINIDTTNAPRSAVKMLGHNFAKLNLNPVLSVTPKMKIGDYKASPLIKKRINPIPIHFVEFDVVITKQQFDTIPKYMCGRETVDQLNSFLETVIIPCFNEKYQLLHKDRSCVRNQNDLELWKIFNEQASSLPGRTFITPGDISRKLNKMLDKKTLNRLTMLRHIGILQEQRVKQTVCYIWSYNVY